MANFTKGVFTSTIWEYKEQADGSVMKVDSGRTASSRYLFDANGIAVIDPTSATGKPYIIPADMNFNQMVINLTDKYNTNIGTAPIDSAKILYDFKTSGSNDLQRMGVNGQDYKGFVSDYTPAASLYFGAVSAGLAVPNNIAEIGGGLLNLRNYFKDGVANPSGDYFNNPKNVPNIQNGLSYYQKNISTNSALDTLINAYDVGVDFMYDLVHLPENIANSLFSSGKNFDFRVDNSAAILSDSILKDLSYLGINPLSTTTIYKASTIITLTLTPSTNNTLIKYDIYNITGTKTSTTVSAYSLSGSLIGRTISKSPAAFIDVAKSSSPSSILETLHQTQLNNAMIIEKSTSVDLGTRVPSVSNTTINNTLPSVPYNFYNTQNQVIDYGFTTGNNGGVSDYPGSSGGNLYYVYPVVLDLDGDGVELVSKENSHAWFDMKAGTLHKQGGLSSLNGSYRNTIHKTGWVGADDGLLVIDENSDGKITLKEMAFAYRTAADDTDLQALASEFDSNRDGKLDVKDTQFSKFRVWKDSNGNGETDAGELMTLPQAKVVSVGLNSDKVSFDIEGNKVSGYAAYTKIDGTTGSVADAAFAYDSNGYSATAKSGYTHLSQTGGLSYAVATGTTLNLSLVTAGVDGAIGGNGNDALSAVGKTTDVVLEGGIGNDIVTGGSGNDWLKGGAGSDTLNGGDGNDTIVMDSADTVGNIKGGNGFDRLLVDGSGAVTMDLNARGFESAVGSDGNDTFTTSGSGRVILMGKTGNDTLTGGGNGDLIEGGSGNDTLNGRGGNDIYGFSKGDGADTINEYETKTTSYTTTEWRVYTTFEFNGQFMVPVTSGYYANINHTNTVELQNGNDTIQLGTDINNIDVERSGNDLILALRDTGNTASIEVLSDRITIKNFNNVNSTIENMSFSDGTTVAINSWQIGTAANDSLNGNSRMYGGRGDDSYIVDSTSDIIIENINAGIDTVESNISYTLGNNLENLTLIGTATIDGTGNTLNNTLNGNSGNNVLNGGGGVDILKGRLGNDTYVVDTTTDSIMENLNEGTDAVQSSISYTLGTNLENLTLTGISAIKGVGNSLNNVIVGNSGNNILDGGMGADTLKGGAGNDTYSIDNVGDIVTENLNEGTDSVQSSVSYALGANIENLTLIGTDAINVTGNELNNTLNGNSGNNILNGGTGADTMLGGAGNDSYIVDNTADVVSEKVNAGIDTIQSSVTYTLGENVENLTLIGSSAINATGNTLANVLYGNDGSNILDGARGNDALYGTGGNDTYVFNKGSGSDNISDNSTVQVRVRRGWFGSSYQTYQTYAGNDTVQFGEGISSKSVALFQRGTDLMISYGNGDIVTIANQSNINNAIEKFTLADGNYLTSNDMNLIIQSMNSYASSHDIAITSIDSVKANQDLMNIVAGAWHK